MENEQLALLIGLACAVILGYFTTRSSNQREKVYGGPLAQIFHYIGAASFTGIVPVVLATVILGGGFLLAVRNLLIFLVVCAVALLIFAVIERPALEEAKRKLTTEDRGWTKEDAITSGL